jgi:serine/threonine protein kinase/tetratricopeptide (TPR) repeat protein
MSASATKAEAVFLAALERPTPRERAAYVEGACAGNLELLERLRELLASHEESKGPLDAPPPGLGVTIGLPPITEGAGTVIGPYKLLQQIGEGGMGVVYMAEQQEPVRRKVALKIIKPGLDTRQVIARFDAERQALALMDHPNIARVLDANTTDSGRPYFVMELVHGVPITQFCDDHQLTPRERLALFVPVCQAIQHAHQKGIIHRDVKPSNVLVTMYDDKPVPKVIDFGVAKAIEQRLTERTMFTQFGALVGTFEYMSPEQAEMNAFGVDTRSDIYSLGVLLYELLTGTTPLERQRLREAALGELVRLIKEEEAPRPSKRLGSSNNLPKIAAARKTEPTRLSKLVQGEIDWIVMKCLDKDRARRYDTASGLARDVERYLADEVVEARPASAGYRLRKFVRKHRTPLTTAVTITLLLLAGVAVSSWQAVRATRAEWQTTQERDHAIQSEKEARLLQTTAQREEQKALKAAAEANAMIRFFKEVMLEAQQTLFDYDQPGRPMPGEAKKFRSKRMDEAVSFIDSEKGRALFAGYPVAEAEIRAWIANLAFPTDGPGVLGNSFIGVASSVSYVSEPGKSYAIRYDPHSARRHLERALELYLRHLGPIYFDTLETMRKLGRTVVALEPGKGLQLLEDSVARSTATFGPDDDETIRCQTSLAQGYDIAEKPAQAARIWKVLHNRAKAKQGIEHDETQQLADRLASSCEKAGRFGEALHQREELLEIKRKRSSGQPDAIVNDLRVIAHLYEELHDYKRAEGLWREIIAGIRSNEDLLSSIKASLGRCLLRCGKLADAEHVLRESLAFQKKKDGWKAGMTESILGRALLAQKKYSDAEPLLLAAREAMKHMEGPTDPPYAGGPDPEDRACALENLGQLVQLYEAMGKGEKADAWRKKLHEAKDAAKKPAKP